MGPRDESQKSIFPQKLWRMVNDQQFNSAIRWTDDGSSFLVFENHLQNKCLGKENNIFYTKQPKSFVRQLHLYGFRKINKNQFTHQYFQRGQPGLLKYIKRAYKPLPTDNNNATPLKTIEPAVTNTTNNISTSNTTNSTSTAAATTATINDHNSNQINCQAIPTHTSAGGTAFANNYDESCPYPISWYEGHYIETGYNYYDDNILTLYNNDIYPNTCDDNNVTW